MTRNEQLASALPIVRKKISRAKFLHETWATLELEHVELFADAGEELLQDLELPEAPQ